MRQHDRTLILLAHPAMSTSRVNRALADAVTDLAHVTVRNLAQVRTRTGYDSAVEQRLVAEHDRIVMQFPWYWYAMPGLLKEWIEQVLTYGFAYGSGSVLHGKPLLLVTTTGAPETAYSTDGLNRFTMQELLLPFEATAHLCGLTLSEPFVVHGARTLTDAALDSHGAAYRALLSCERS